MSSEELRHRILLSVQSLGHYGRAVARGASEYFQQVGGFHIRYEGLYEEEKIWQAISDWDPQGCLFQWVSADIAQRLKRRGIPAVTSSSLCQGALPGVISDNVGMGRQAARHFLERGFRHFGFVTSPVEWVQQRLKGVCQEIAGRGDLFVFDGRSQNVYECTSEDEKRAGQWLEGLPSPVAIIAPGDFWARFLVMECHRRGLAVPQERAIMAGENDPLLCGLSIVPLSAMINPAFQIGQRAALLLEHMLAGGSAPTEPILVPSPGVAIRQSSEYWAMGNKDLAAAMEMISQRPEDIQGVADLARRLSISRRKLELLFQQHMGSTVYREIRRVRLDRAKLLLTEGKARMHEVAKLSGFPSYAVFARIFRQDLGMTPSQFQAGLGMGAVDTNPRSDGGA